MARLTPGLAIGLIFLTLIDQSYGQFGVGFYAEKCSKDIEQVIFSVVKAAFDKDPSLVAAMLRMQFHDCFVNGCDASILIDGQGTEKTAVPNLTVRGYELIDNAKTEVEKVCPGVVSCADIIVICTRVTVFLAQGNWYEVETGRKHGRVSRAIDALNSLLPPSIPVPNAVKAFSAKGLSTQDFVLLLAGHTVGIAHCGLFQDRLYNFKGTNKSDPSISPRFLPDLKKTCPSNGSGNNLQVLDQSTPLDVDNGFFESIVARKGILQIDQDIAFNPLTKFFVSRYASNSEDFDIDFGKAMVNLGKVGVSTGSERGGEIRRSCRFIN